MKNLKNLFFASLAIVTLTVACDEEFLTKEPQASLSGPALANSDGVEGKLVSAYRTLAGYGMSGGGTWYYSTWSWIFGAISSDNALKGTDVEEIKKKTQDLVQASMKLGEAIYKSQQSTKPGDAPKDAKEEEGKKDDNVVDADFEEVKDDKEKSA